MGRELAGYPDSPGGPGEHGVICCGYHICSILGAPEPGKELAGPFWSCPDSNSAPLPTTAQLDGTRWPPTPDLALGLPQDGYSCSDPRNDLQTGSFTALGQGLNACLGPWGEEELQGPIPTCPVRANPKLCPLLLAERLMAALGHPRASETLTTQTRASTQTQPLPPPPLATSTFILQRLPGPSPCPHWFSENSCRFTVSAKKSLREPGEGEETPGSGGSSQSSQSAGGWTCLPGGRGPD